MLYLTNRHEQGRLSNQSEVNYRNRHERFQNFRSEQSISRSLLANSY
jgi:hypothetical protein